MDRDSARKAAGVALVAVGVGVGGWIFLMLTDIATFWWVFNRMSTVLAGRGLNSDLASMSGIAFAIFSAVAAHGTGWLLLTRKTHLWALKVGAIMLVWYGAMYAVSYQYSGGVIDIWTAKARVKIYRDSNNRIVTVPLAAKSGPEGQPLTVIERDSAEEYTQQDLKKETVFNIYTGSPQFKYYRDSKSRVVLMLLTAKSGPEGQSLTVIDQKTADEYMRQGGVRKTLRNPYTGVEETFLSIGETKATEASEESTLNQNQVATDYNLEIRVERIQTATDRTIVYLACKGRPPQKSGPIGPHVALASYLVDDSGRSYDLIADSDDTTIDRKGRLIRADETYRFRLAFPVLPEDVSKLRLHLSGFSPALDLDTALAKAEKVPAIKSVKITNPLGTITNPVASTGADDGLVLWVDKIALKPDGTTIYLSCQGKDKQAGWLKPNSNLNNFVWNGQTYLYAGPPAVPYLVDDSGQPYYLSSDSAIYDSVLFSRGQPLMPAHYVRAGEIYHFVLTFQPVPEGVSDLRLHLHWFKPALDLRSALAHAEKIPAIPSPLPAGRKRDDDPASDAIPPGRPEAVR